MKLKPLKLANNKISLGSIFEDHCYALLNQQKESNISNKLTLPIADIWLEVRIIPPEIDSPNHKDTYL